MEYNINLKIDVASADRGVRKVEAQLGKVTDTANLLRETIANTFSQFGKLERASTSGFRSRERALMDLRDAYDSNLNVISDYINTGGNLNRAQATSQKITKQYAAAVDALENPHRAVIESLKQEARLADMSNADREVSIRLRKIESQTIGGLTSAQRALVEGQLRDNQSKRAQAELLQRIRGPADTYARQQKVLNQLLRRGKIDAKQYQRTLKSLKMDLKGTGGATGSLRRGITGAFAALGVGFGAREVIGLADSYTKLQNRLRVVTRGQEELASVTEELFEISGRTRSSFESTVELYSRLSLSASELGVSQAQLAQFTESLNKAIILSGASAQEASAGLIQLSQGLASGALRGDELRSVLEQLPAVADVIAKELGVTRGAIRAMGAEGKLTADIILRAFANARGELDDRFSRTVPTLSQAFQRLRDSAVKSLGELNKSTGGLQLLSQTLNYLARNMDTIVNKGSKLAFVIGTILAAGAIPKLIKSIRLLTATVRRNPILFGLSAAVAVFGDDFVYLIKKSLELSKTQKQLIAIQRQLNQAQVDTVLAGAKQVAASKLAKRAYETITPTIAEYTKQLEVERQFMWASDEVRDAGLAVLKLEKKIRDDLAKASLSLTDAQNKELRGQLDRVRNMTLINSSLSRQADLLKQIRSPSRDFNQTIDDLNQLLDRGQITVREFGQALEQTNLGAKFVEIERLAMPAIKSQDQALAALRKTYDANLRVVAEYAEVSGDWIRASEVSTNIVNQYAKAVEMTNPVLRTQVDLLEQIQAPLKDYQLKQEALSGLLRKGAIDINQYNTALAGTQLGGQLQGLRGDLLGRDDPMAQEQARYQQQLAALEQFLNADSEIRREALALREEAQKQHLDRMQSLEMDGMARVLGASAQLFGSITQLTKNFAGDQSQAYKILFATTKAFAIAQASVLAGLAISKAIAAAPWPANSIPIAEAIAATSAVIAQIGSVAASGFQTGGSFKVGGSGDADSQMVMFKASPNETVSVRTPSQQRTEDRQQAPAQVQPNIKIANILDPSLVLDAMQSERGEKVFLNMIRKHDTQINAIMSRRRS